MSLAVDLEHQKGLLLHDRNLEDRRVCSFQPPKVCDKMY